MRVEVVHDQMDRRRLWILHSQVTDEAGELKGGSIGCGAGEMTTSLGFHCTEHIGRTTSSILVIAAGLSAGNSWQRRPNVAMQGHRFFVQADHWLLRIVWAFIGF